MATGMHSAGKTLGRYELIARIGEGGMAEVHLARQRGPMAFEKLVVVKTVHPRLASRPAVAEALLDEAKIAAKVKHPHVVDIYDLGEEDGTYFIAMEYLEGESMTSVIRAQRQPGAKRLPPLRTARIIADCAAGLHAAHELRSLAGEPLELVHQDVTPGNVIVLYTGQSKLVDFGVAKVRTSESAGLVKGKAGYLAPELFDKKAADRRSDVFALGVVLWESLTLRRLFAGPTESETFLKIKACQVPPPSTLAPGVPPGLDRICAKALTKSPADRYQTAEAMRDELQSLLRATDRGDYEPIAQYMRETFKTQIAARQQLFRELDRGEVPASGTIEAIVSTGEDGSPATPPRAVSTGSFAAGSDGSMGETEATDVGPAMFGAGTVRVGGSVPVPVPVPASVSVTGAVPVPATVTVTVTGSVSVTGSEPVSVTGSEPDSVPGSEAVSVTGSEPVAVAAAEAEAEAELADEDITIEPAPVSKRVWIGAGIAAALGAVVAIVLVSGGGSKPEVREPARGSVIAEPTTVPPAQIEVAAPPVEVAPPVDVTPPADVAPPVVAPPVDVVPPVDVGSGKPVVAKPVTDGDKVVKPVVPVDDKGKPGGADAGSAKPVVRDPAKAAALSQQAMQRFMSGDNRGAIESFQAALKEDRSYAPAHRGLGLAYEKSGDRTRAARAFRSYLGLAPNARDAAQIRTRLEKL